MALIFCKLICHCGCGQDVRQGRRYRQGHDARHVSVLARQVISGETTKAKASNQLATIALQTKLERALANAKGDDK